jgi:hypothetical protein
MMAPFSMKKFFCGFVALLSVVLSSAQLVKGNKVSNNAMHGGHVTFFLVYIERKDDRER